MFPKIDPLVVLVRLVTAVCLSIGLLALGVVDNVASVTAIVAIDVGTPVKSLLPKIAVPLETSS